MRTFTIEADID